MIESFKQKNFYSVSDGNNKQFRPSDCVCVIQSAVFVIMVLDNYDE